MQSAEKKRTFAYEVDATNTLVDVSSDWLEFARENRSESLDREHVIGKPLFDFVTGKETRHLYTLLLARIRKSGQRAVVPFRCDAPNVRRYMELQMTALDEGAVRFEGRIVREEPRDPVPLLDPSKDRSEEFVLVCSWCKRVAANGDWLEVESAVTRMELFHATLLPQITHGICPACETGVRGELEVPS